jgi:hypothetical protein
MMTGGVNDKCTTFLTRTAPEKDVGLFVVVDFIFFRENNGRKRLTGAGRACCL